MPELPEVETVVRSIARIVGRRIVSAEFTCARILRGDPDQMSAMLAGRRIRAIRRRGKFIVIELDAGHCLVVHLGMTGKLLLGGTPGRHTHAIVNLDRGVLRYEDQRQFGKIEVSRGLPARVEKLGPEPLEITLAEFAARLKRRKARIKSVLLDQHFVGGVGNIYADEALFRAGIHPLAIGERLRPERVKRAARGHRGSADAGHRERRLLDFRLCGRRRPARVFPIRATASTSAPATRA